MSVFTQFTTGSRVPTSIVNLPVLTNSMDVVPQYAAAVTSASGLVTANVLKTALSVSGAGQLNWLGVYSTNSTSKTIRVKVTIDGVAIRDYTSAAIAVTNRGFTVIGTGVYTTNDQAVNFQPCPFNTSLLVEFTTDIGETNGVTIAWNYELQQ